MFSEPHYFFTTGDSHMAHMHFSNAFPEFVVEFKYQYHVALFVTGFKGTLQFLLLGECSAQLLFLISCVLSFLFSTNFDTYLLPKIFT
jgi:hypothetical protein